MTRKAIVAGGVLAAVVVPVAVATAAKPPQNQLKLTSSAAIITFGQGDTLSGQLTGPHNTGVKVQLQEQPAPFTTAFKNVAGAEVTTDNAGKVTFPVQHPTVSTHYRAVANASPRVTSPTLTLPVRYKVTLRLSDYTPKKGQRVRFSGSCAPANNGAIAFIQRRTATGGWRTVSRAVLKAAATGNLSTYSKRIRLRSSGVFRTRVLHTSTNATGTSRAKRERVH